MVTSNKRQPSSSSGKLSQVDASYLAKKAKVRSETFASGIKPECNAVSDTSLDPFPGTSTPDQDVALPSRDKLLDATATLTSVLLLHSKRVSFRHAMELILPFPLAPFAQIDASLRPGSLHLCSTQEEYAESASRHLSSEVSCRSVTSARLRAPMPEWAPLHWESKAIIAFDYVPQIRQNWQDGRQDTNAGSSAFFANTTTGLNTIYHVIVVFGVDSVPNATSATDSAPLSAMSRVASADVVRAGVDDLATQKLVNDINVLCSIGKLVAWQSPTALPTGLRMTSTGLWVSHQTCSLRGPWILSSAATTEPQIIAALQPHLQALARPWSSSSFESPKRSFGLPIPIVPGKQENNAIRVDGRLSGSAKRSISQYFSKSATAWRAARANSAAMKAPLSVPTSISTYRSIERVVIYVRTSSKVHQVGVTLCRQILSVVARPPPDIAPDWNNVKQVNIIAERLSSAKVPMSDRKAMQSLLKGLRKQPATVVVATNVDRLTRRASELDELVNTGAPIWFQGVRQLPNAVDLDDFEAPEDEETIEKRESSAGEEDNDNTIFEEDERGKWRLLDHDIQCAKMHLDSAMILATEQSLYTGSRVLMSRILTPGHEMQDTIKDMQIALVALQMGGYARQHGLTGVTFVMRVSPDGTDDDDHRLTRNESLTRQRAFMDHVFKGSDLHVSVCEVAYASASADNNPVADKLVEMNLTHQLVVAVTLDRFSRNANGWNELVNINDRLDNELVALLWPHNLLKNVLSDGPSILLGSEDHAIRLQCEAYSVYQHRQPSFLPTLVSGARAGTGARAAAKTGITQAAGSIIGRLASSWQGNLDIKIPPAVLAASRDKRWNTKTAAYDHALLAHLSASVTPYSPPKFSITHAYGRNAVDCFCFKRRNGAEHPATCRCDCSECRSAVELHCLYRGQQECSVLCNCSCRDHHGGLDKRQRLEHYDNAAKEERRKSSWIQ